MDVAGGKKSWKKGVCVCRVYRPVNNEKSFLKVLEMCRQKGKMGNLLYLNFETVTIFEQYMEGENEGRKDYQRLFIM